MGSLLVASVLELLQSQCVGHTEHVGRSDMNSSHTAHCIMPTACLAGMAADPTAAARIRRTGLGIIPPSLGISALASMLRVVASGSTLISGRLAAAVPVDWQRLLGGAKDSSSLAFFSDFAPAVVQEGPVAQAKRQQRIGASRPKV